ncbi:acetoin dehydrogenase dihydrolipoyllysine-residue acetyltransferase subunit [Rhizobium wuzhouense]|nr:acetoin dehydrogenase dihydrolipoyllysine-residue acetyltransferase subunit [Rhizobium wuzhouense]
MARPILMPQVGQDLTEGKITALNIKLGDKVKKGDIVAEVESEKAVFEVEAFETGTVMEIRYKVGDMATVLEPIIMVGSEGEVLETAAATSTASVEVQAAATTAIESVSVTPVERGRDLETAFLKAGTGGSSPLARRLAGSAGVDIAQIPGTGPRGAVVKRDVEAFQRSKPGVSSVLPFSGGTVRATTGGALPLRTLQSGTGDPVVLIHGFGGDVSAWRPFVAHIGLANPILALDLPGHGAAAASSVSDFDSLTAAVHATLAASGIDRLHLVGHSLGAAVAASIAGGGSLQVRSLSLLSPAGLGPRINGDYVAGFLSSTSEAALKVWLELLVLDPSSLPGVLVRATLSAREGTAMVDHQARLAAGVFAGNTQLFSIRDALHRFGGPVRAIIGREDRIIPSEQADAVPSHVGLYRLPNVGHLPQLEAAPLVGRLIAENVRSAG